ncbi:MAG: phosphotransferase family protein [Frankia sp.]|nr:phosphotransferase family protein [Frankia sp.]
MANLEATAAADGAAGPTSPPAAEPSVESTVWDWTDETRGRLERFLSAQGLTEGPVTTRRIGDGHSNLTFLVEDGSRRRVVVRRGPPPPLPPGAHDMLREARFVSALGATAVPVAKVLATAAAGEVLDVPFYVMSYADGPVVTTRTPHRIASPLVRRQIGEALVDTLVELHAVDWRAAGLADLGRPDGFNARHVRRMGQLVADADGAPPAPFALVDAWLRAHVPAESDAAIVHNDYRIGNVVLAPDPPGRVMATLDWELATIGDPLHDVGYFLASVPEPGVPLTPTQRLGVAMLEDGYPSREELAARYQERSGRDLGPGLDRLRWYTTFALWKLAALYEYGWRRARAGGGDPYYADHGHVWSFLAAAHAAAGLPPFVPPRDACGRRLVTG